ncbi:MAG: shikimate dehydrogenase [Acidobacteriota bacterium]|nr:shikimate dehydrogenase [Acidobacteriota bacterium]
MNNGKICISICADTADEFIKDIKRAEESADVIELRFDCLNESEIKQVWNSPASSKEEICTFRPKEQGGKRSISEKERLEFWSIGNKLDWVDFEIDLYEMNVTWNHRMIICSHHDFNGVPENLNEIYNRLKMTNADVLKIAVQANEIIDSIAVWKLLERAKKENKQIIPIAMGEAGRWTRILGLAHGAFMTYAALDAGKKTASGQITARDLIKTYRVKELNEQTEIYGIVGDAVSHSVSPFMHNAAFKLHNLNAVYIPFEVKNLDKFIAKFIREKTREIELNFKGFSVTIPHKQAIIKHLDSIDETAKAVGAVNTVKIIGGKLYGYNTDARGFIEPLKNAYGDLKNAKVAVLGGGGAARAAIHGLRKEEAQVTVFARDLEKGRSLAEQFKIQTSRFKAQNESYDDFDIVVNATPLGTIGEVENETPAVTEQIKNVHLVYDLVYNPFETRFLREARSVGVPTVGGLAMLVAQGAAQFEIWTGKTTPLKEMSQIALRKLQS